jgi:hypothetical protein
MLPCAVVLVGAVLGLGPTGDGADEATGLQQRVAALETRLDRLEATRRPDRWLTERRAAEIRGLVIDVLADADSRTAGLEQPLTGGWDGDFFVRSADGNYLLRAFGVVQTRFVYNHQNDSPSGDDDQSGFEMSRLRLKTTGHVIDPTWQYFVQVELAQKPGLRDATITKVLGGGWSVRAGQAKLPFTRERLTSATKTLAVDRSLVDQTYAVGRSAGLELDYNGERWRFRANVNNGAKSLGASALSTGTDFAFAGRADMLAFGGTWPQFSEFRGPIARHAGVLLGAAFFYQQNNASAASPDDERVAVTADVSAKWEHSDAFASVIWNYVDPGDPASPSMSQLGVVIQGGVFVADQWEVFARYEWSDFDSAGVSDLSVVTVGVIRFFNGNNLKWTTDVGVGLNPVASEFAATALGWRADAPGEDGQVVVRSQLQLLF